MNNDVFEPPKSQEETDQNVVNDHLGLRWGGAKYFISCFALFLLHFVVFGSLVASGIGFPNWIGGVILNGVLIYLTTFRLRDFNQSGWYAFIMLIPGLNLLLIIVLTFIPGTPGANKYGYPP